MKRENRRIALAHLREEPLSRAELSQKTGLTQAAISNIADELLQSGIVQEIGKVKQSEMGRKPIALEICRNWGYAVGVNMDRDCMEVCVINLKGEPVGDCDKISGALGVEETLDKLTALITRHMGRVQSKGGRIIGIGIVVPGPVDIVQGRILNPPAFEKWHDFPIRQEFEKRFPETRVFVELNSDALARSEFTFGQGKEFQNFAALSIGDAGIGLGLVLRGKPFRNGNGCGIGHTCLDIHGRLCACGNRGCLEAYATTAAVLWDVQRVKKELHTWEEFIDACYAGDAYCLAALQEQAGYLAQALNNLNNLLGLDAVILNGKVHYRGQLLAGEIEKHLSRLNPGERKTPLRILLSRVAVNAHAIAAASVAVDQLFYSDLYYDLLTQEGEEDEET